jgi:hypothetical protein
MLFIHSQLTHTQSIIRDYSNQCFPPHRCLPVPYPPSLALCPPLLLAASGSTHSGLRPLSIFLHPHRHHYHVQQPCAALIIIISIMIIIILIVIILVTVIIIVPPFNQPSTQTVSKFFSLFLQDQKKKKKVTNVITYAFEQVA